MCRQMMFVKLSATLIVYASVQVAVVTSQDYDVSDVQCTFGSNSGVDAHKTHGLTATRDTIAARLRKPEGFKGSPIFADDRQVDPLTDVFCQIRPDVTDSEELTYDLLITDFSRCGVLKRNGFVHVRIWFPQFPGVVMMSDQELIIMCKPPEPTIIENKAAGFAGSFPNGARVSGVVEETPGRLEYEVALYKEAPPIRVGNNSNSELPVDQAVPIGTKLQLRARINPDSAWKYVKLMEVTVSPDPDDPHMSGSVALVKDGCRNRDFASIIPHQPARYRERHNEVFLDFEAFLLSNMRERSTLWIHSQIKACMDATDCQPEYCLDLFEPAGHGRRKRRHNYYPGSVTNQSYFYDHDDSHHNSGVVQIPHAEALTSRYNTTPSQFTKFNENIEYTVLMPGDFYHSAANSLEGSCSTFLVIAAVLGCLLFLSAFIMCYLVSRLHSTLASTQHTRSIDQLVRDHKRKYSVGPSDIAVVETSGYTGRNTVQ
ncbi:uncharacterized protein LOC111868717 isoform X2 [Cryptotermes secundus]|nr:uncharacterized protein LOC111868717 isoform X2 [Cryptotermes secundus]